ncbi:MAG: pyridoxal phosphate-dependent aminotransferase [Bryobacterales bacterium]|nr:pyridoxal phosphate-dependent aminotransferase [Bryobacterales bacterium]
MARVAESALAVPHSRIRDIADIAMAMGEGVLRMHFGESNLPTPAFIQEAAQRALRDGYTYYTENAGLPSLRRAIADHYGARHGVEIDPAGEVVVTASGVQALNVGMRCVLDAGDEAMVLTPAWQNQMSIPRMFHASVKMVPLALRGGGYRVDFDAMEAAVGPRTRLLIYTSPSNPLGWVATIEEQQGLLEFARRHGLWLLADEVYERLWYPEGGELGQPVPSILRVCGREDAVLVVQSFSKSYCMTGWRVGWIVARRDLADRATKLNEFIISSAPAFAQRAGETALAEGEGVIAGMLAAYRGNRDFCVEALGRMPGVTVPRAEGAFYLFPRIAGLRDSFGFCERLVREAGLSLAPGVAFGEGGEGSIRICYAVERGMLAEAMERLAGGLGRM